MMHIDKLFKEKIYNHEAVVPEGMWEKIAPIAEEESGRALLWFWIAGALALILGGYGIYKMLNINTPSDPSTLVYQDQTNAQSPELSVDNSLINTTNSNPTETNENSKEILEPSKTDLSNSNVINDTPKKVVNKNNIPHKIKVDSNTPGKQPKQNVSNTVESITNVVGSPANLVITKSYINKEGSVIKQSNLTETTGNEGPIYDVIINSEAKDLNAGALLRIIEPLESIPLPALQKQLKKKNPTTPF